MAKPSVATTLTHDPPVLLCLVIPMRTKNPLNGSQGRTRGAMYARAAERKAQRRHVSLHLMAYDRLSNGLSPAWAVHLNPGIIVTLTRIAPRRLDDDGLTAALKSVRDAVADWLMAKDNDPRITWRYSQRRGEPKTYAVEVTIT